MRARRLAGLGLLPLVALALATTCGDSSGPVASDTFDRRALLGNLTTNLFLPLYQRFDAQADALSTAVAASCAALGGGEEQRTRESAQEAFRQAMLTWQLAESMLVGPAIMDGRTLRDRIYAWPVISSCAVDQEVMSRSAAPAAYDIATKLANRRGLAAIEYLLFQTSLAGSCPPQAAPAGWDALGDAEKRSARCGLAQVAAADVSAQAQRLLDAWLPEHGNFAAALKVEGSSPFATPQAAVNEVSDALFYVDSEVKDMKLGQPAGISQNSCATVQEPCLQDLEHPFADLGKEAILANLRGLEHVFLGTGLSGEEGLGFDEFLQARNAADVASALRTDLVGAIAKVEAIPGTLREAVVSNRAAVVEAHAAVKRITDALKSTFITALALDVPDDAAADND